MTEPVATGDNAPGRLLDRTFTLVTLSALAYFLALGIVTPVLPRYVQDELDGGGVAIGVVVGSFAVTAALFRPLAGRIGDRFGRRVLTMGGSAVVGLSVAAYGVAATIPGLVALRLVSGVGEAAMFVGAATAIQDLAPADRRGEAASYFSVAVFGGLGLGAPLGEAVFHAHGSTAVWVLAAAFCAAAFVFGLSVPAFAPGIDGVGVPPPRRQLLQPDALRPGVVLALAMTGVAAFSTFVPVYVGSIGVENAAIVFTINACIILAVRLTSARIPDRWGSLRTATRCLSVMSLGLAAIGLVGSPAGLYTATVVYSLGQSLIYPALLPLAIGRAPVSERSNAMATFTLFFDVSQGLGAVVLGAVVALANERAAFLVAAAVVFSALFVLRLGPLGREAPAPAAAEAA